MHDIGAISAMSSDSQAMGRVGEVITRTWQTADKVREMSTGTKITASSTYLLGDTQVLRFHRCFAFTGFPSLEGLGCVSALRWRSCPGIRIVSVDFDVTVRHGVSVHFDITVYLPTSLPPPPPPLLRR